ncbi:MAG: type 1 glutamine amidotransferase [Betaproteobacteria bacterium]|nr:type 1 glutamine amidotransferase [Betaproteobacteria bacterium]
MSDKPILVLRHAPTEGPGYLETFLAGQGLRAELVPLDQGAPVPRAADAFAGLVLMGGPMSVNDALPWIPLELSLIREAVGKNIPVLGHCLGGQLLAKALGAAVVRNPVKEIGWADVEVTDEALAREWLGADFTARRFPVFHWHGETFAIPEGATRMLKSAYCANQAYVLGRHLGMQCHVEMTEEMVASWCRVGADEIRQSPGPGVQDAPAMMEDLAARVRDLNAIAARLYTRWIAGLA